MSTPEMRAASELNERFQNIQFRGNLGESFSRLKSGIDGLSLMAGSRSPFDTEDGHRVKVAKSAQRLEQQLARIKESALAEYAKQSGTLSSQIIDKCNLRPNKYEQEIRQVLLAMPSHADRLEWLQGVAQDASNGPILGALLDCPPALHGIQSDALKAIEQGFIERNAAELVAQQSQLDEALQTISALHRTAERMAQSHQDHRELARIEQDASRAEAAASQLEQAMA